MRRAAFEVDQMVELRYRAQLRKIAQQVAMIAQSFPTTDAQSVKELEQALETYAAAIRPWATKAALLMLQDSRRSNDIDWRRRLGIRKNGTPPDQDTARPTSKRGRVGTALGRNLRWVEGLTERT